MNKEVDEPMQYDQKKKRASKTKQRSRKNCVSHGRKSSTGSFNENSGSFKEEESVERSLQSQPTVNSTSSSSSSKMTSRTVETSPPSPCPVFRPYDRQDRSSRTEAHPNALKNIKNYPLLLASITQTVNHIEENRRNLSRRSVSTVDFRHLDMEKTSKLFGLEEH